ncbi:MAG: HAD family hydrolase, partial [Bacilli bacterium]
LILATNPLFPKIATENRIKWANIDSLVFTHITTYENSYYSKPNIKYYQEIFTDFNIDPSESLMVGNDMSDDFVVTELGCDIYIVTDHLINKDNLKLPEKSSNMEELIKYLKKLI